MQSSAEVCQADNSGQEIWEYYRGGESRPYETTSRTFTWKWMDKSMEGLTLNYGAGEIKYFDNVWGARTLFIR